MGRAGCGSPLQEETSQPWEDQPPPRPQPQRAGGNVIVEKSAGYGIDRQSNGGFLCPTASGTLNADPFNLRAEELALQECTLGVDVRRTWTETEMVRSFGGQMSPGTPDGMFESWDGALTCVQVVRVPLVAESAVCQMQETLAATVVTKVVKSQRWLRFSHAQPQDFVIFCWLPFTIPDEVVEHAEVLMDRIRRQDHRFSLRLRTPTDPSSLFPKLFAKNSGSSSGRSHNFAESDVSTYTGSEQGEDEEEEVPEWDITWGWDEEAEASPAPAAESDASGLVDVPAASRAESAVVAVETTTTTREKVAAGGPSADESDDDEVMCEWNFTWDDGG